MKFLIIQENGRHAKNRHFRECFSMQRSLINSKQECEVWGLGHANFDKRPDFNSYDVIINLENYDSGWVPNLAEVNKYKILWSIDSHCPWRNGMLRLQFYKETYNKGKYNLMLQATKDFVDQNSVWFPNCYDHTLIYPREVKKRSDVGFCGNVANRGNYLKLLKANYDFIADIFVIGDDMVNAINSYRIHFNANVFNDINYRSFETIGCNIPLVTNYNPQYLELGFKDGENCMLYKNPFELGSKIQFLLDNPEKRQEISQKGYELSKNHTYNKRGELLLEILKGKI
jgi:spore maturation protein CgeB